MSQAFLTTIRNLHARIQPQAFRLPSKSLILITSPRAGSTWLFDALRVHPKLEILPQSTIFNILELRGNRYPLDLTNGPDDEYEIELQTYNKTRIPIFSACDDICSMNQKNIKDMSGLEKLHPEFYNFDTQRFLSNLDILARKTKVCVVYQVREPVSSITSFLDYQTRNPYWYSHMTAEDIFVYYAKTYRSIRDCQTKTTGLVVDYSEMRRDVTATVMKIWRHTWPEAYCNSNQIENLDRLAHDAEKLTLREKRTKSSTLFLGPHVGSAFGSQGRFTKLMSSHRNLIEECRQYYSEITDCDREHP